ncbi:MAG: MATE family efflux transporter, partial [Bacteroidaceae bacterium]
EKQVATHQISLCLQHPQGHDNRLSTPFNLTVSNKKTCLMIITEKELQTKRIAPLFRAYFFPTLFAMIAISLVTIADGFFVGRGVGADGVAAVNIVWAPMMIFVGLGLMLGIGCGVTSTIALARGDKTTARRHVTQAITLGLLIVVILATIMLANPSATAKLLGASDTLQDITIEYMVYLIPGFVIDIFCLIGQFVLRCDGRPKTAMWSTLLPGITNVVLDWLLVFHLDMGIKGAALATSLSFVVGSLIVFFALIKPNSKLRLLNIFSKNTWVGATRNISRQCLIGLSALLGELVMAMTMFLGNIETMRLLGDAGVGAFGVVCYYLPFIFLMGNAIAQSGQPILSFNYGRRNTVRVRETFHYMIKIAMVCGLICAFAFFFLNTALTSLFIPADSPAGTIAIEAFPYYAACALPYIFNIVAIGYFQSVERAKPSIVFALMRGTVFLVPSFVLLPLWLGSTGVWLALTVSELSTTLFIVLFYMRKRG